MVDTINYDQNYSDNEGTTNLSNKKRTIFILLIVIIIGFLVFFSIKLLAYLFDGRLVVVTSSSNTVIISQSLGYKSQQLSSPLIKTITANKSINLKPGNYLVTVSSKSFETQQEVDIVARKTAKITINLKDTSTFIPVVSDQVSGLTASNTAITYFNVTNGNLYTVNNTGKQLISSNLDIVNLKWLNSNYGIAKSASGGLYVVKNGSLNQLNLPFRPISTDQYALSPNGQLYISNNHSIYLQLPTSTFKKLHTFNNQIISISANRNGAAVYTGSNELDQNKNASQSSMLSFVSTDGSIKNTSTGDTTILSWSPDGIYLAGLVNGFLQIWNTNLQKVNNLSDNGIDSLVWLNNNTIIFGLNNGVWEYSLITKKAVLMTQSTTGQQVTSITFNQNNMVLYVGLENIQQSTPTYQLDAIYLNGYTPSNLNLLEQLAVYLPNTINGCYIGYSNFNVLNITVQAPPSMQQVCLQVAQSYLQQYGVNINNLNFTLVNY